MRLEELSHILISVVTISIAFTIAFTQSVSFDSHFATEFVTILITVGAGFVLHELAHRGLARHYGAWAEYRSWTLGLALALVMAVALGIVFAAPGATYIYGPHLDKDKNGKIALAGPVTNLVLGLGFAFLAFSVPALASLGHRGAEVNFFLGAFNLIPIFPLDGQKVFVWNKAAWAATGIALVGLLLLFLGS